MALGFGFNKVKVLASAEKFVQQGKLQNAIAEYEKVVREDPKDLTVLNTIGDLYARLGDNDHAVHYFKKVGDQYAQSGFTVKAIAIYKKLSNLSANNADHITRLAELYTQQGLFRDARAQYMLIADAHLRSGEHSQAARVFQRILELDPENTATQAKLADLYMKLGKKEDALKIYTSAAEGLYVKGSFEAAAEALNKVITLDPKNPGAMLLRGMIATDSGDSVSAIRYLEQVPDREARPETLHALLRARLNSDEIEGAEAEAQALLDRHNDPSGISSLAEWYIDHDQVSSAVGLYEKNAGKLFGGDAAVLQNTVHALISKAKNNPDAVNRLQHLLQKDGEGAPSAEKMEAQAHAHAQKGEFAQARDLYKKLSEIEPENALHNQNYRQMLAKLGEDPATRILTPEEAAQAFMVEELDQSSVLVQQKYDPPTETAIESALTDAELYVSYNVPSKAIAPLEAALPLAPKDITLNQRLATLYARAERYTDAARICQNLSDIYRELGHANEAARYQEAARKYGLRAGIGPATTPLAPRAPATPPPPSGAEPSAQAEIAAPASMPGSGTSAEEPASSVQEFSFDVTEQIAAEPEPVTLSPEPATVPELDLHVYSAETKPAPEEAEVEIEIEPSAEWEEMLSVEVVEPESTSVKIAGAPSAHDTQKLEPEPVELAATPEPALEATVKEPEGGSDVCYLADEKVQEVQFYISQQMWQAARNALKELGEVAPESPQLPELMAAVSAGEQKSAPEIAPPEAAPATLEQAAAPAPPMHPGLPQDPFAAHMPASSAAASASLQPPVPQTPKPPPADPFAAHMPAPSRQQPALSPKNPVAQPIAQDAESILDLGNEIAPPPQKPTRTAAVRPQPAAIAASTEDILTDFVHDLENSELQDFVPKSHAEPAAPASSMAATRAATPTLPESVPGTHTNGTAQVEDTGSVLAGILSDLQEETAEAAEPEEDPETHYNLGIAFKEMGLLDEAIGELQKVCRAVDKGHSFSQPIQAYTWLAQCLVDKGAPEAAVRWYQKALKIPALDDSSRCAIYYDLAAAYEAFGDKKSALANFMEVYGSNIDFRDVAGRIKALKS
ncbi:MAG TPA: tetratricopeptide repeat protein [Candidatus Angelobacter sp.]|nr:tetratricopeptide repeat protein [Candidatus Angelobacter sp.]